jgi:hypothetical protein
MEYYVNCIPKMKDFDILIRVDVVGYLIIIGTQTNVQDLSLGRHFLRFRNAVTIKVGTRPSALKPLCFLTVSRATWLTPWLGVLILAPELLL